MTQALTHVWWGADTASDFRAVADPFAAHYGNLPTFMGRYVSDFVPSGDELAYYRAHHMATLLICNAEDGTTSNGDYSDGFLLGQQAAAVAHRLGYPKRCFLPIDIEAGFLLSSYYLVGYFHGVDQGGYTAGAYLNVLNANHVAAWKSARSQYSLPAYIYSSEPEPYAIWDMVEPAFYDFSQTLLGPQYAGDVVIWQYGENELGQRVDLDVATDKGYSMLWLPDPVVPVAHKVIAKATLKTYPNHTCKGAIDPAHQTVVLQPGTVVHLTGKRTPHWSELTLANSPVHGWLLTDNIS